MNELKYLCLVSLIFLCYFVHFGIAIEINCKGLMTSTFEGVNERIFIKVVPHHKPPINLKFNFSENDITEKPLFNPYAWKI